MIIKLGNISAPQEKIKHEEPNTTLALNEIEIGKGTLYITEDVIVWINNITQQGFSLEYPSIVLHGFQGPPECLLVMANVKVDISGVKEDNKNRKLLVDYVVTPTTKMTFTPDNLTSLGAMYRTLDYCQSLRSNPPTEGQ